MKHLSHIDSEGKAVMVDVGQKAVTARKARAEGRITLSKEAFLAVMDQKTPKGDVISTARIAGIMGAKRTHDLIPMCHPLLIDQIEVELVPCTEDCSLYCTCTIKMSGKTGAEMEALTGVSVTLLTVYDMVKAIDHRMVIGDIRLIEKTGGKSGHFLAPGIEPAFEE